MTPFNNLISHSAERQTMIEEALVKVSRSGIFLFGPELETFENEYARFIGTSYALGCGSGLDAIWLMLRAAIENGHLSPGDEVLVPANTYIATIMGIMQAGLTPVLVEPDYETCQISAREAEKAISQKTRAIMLVHLYGICSWSDAIGDLVKHHGLIVFEDNAQAHGCMTADGRLTGSLGLAAAHSFYPTKNLGALGDGGAVTTDDPGIAEVVAALRNYGSSKKNLFRFQGRNSRLDELQAAVLRVKLSFLNADNKRRIFLAKRYFEKIDPTKTTYPTQPHAGGNVFHIFPIFSNQRDLIARRLLINGVQTMVHYPIPPHRQPCLSQFSHLSLPVTDRLHSHELSLPIWPDLDPFIVDKIAHIINL